jgi:hypothetical protein
MDRICIAFNLIRFEVFMAVTMKNAIFRYITPCSCFKNRRFGRRYRHHHQGDRNRRSLLRLLVTANDVPSSPILVNMVMEAIRSSRNVGSYKATLFLPSQKMAFFALNLVDLSYFTSEE